MGQVARLPDRNRSWLREIERAYSKALKKAAKDGRDPELVYLYAVGLAAEARGISDPREVERIQRKIIGDVRSDLEKGEPFEVAYKFHFVWSYIFANVEAGLIEARAGDQIMGYINETIMLFDRG